MSYVRKKCLNKSKQTGAIKHISANTQYLHALEYVYVNSVCSQLTLIVILVRKPNVLASQAKGTVKVTDGDFHLRK